jgi:hypothetical protein
MPTVEQRDCSIFKNRLQILREAFIDIANSQALLLEGENAELEIGPIDAPV